MSDVSDLAAARWDKNDNPADCRPDEALHAALRYIAENEMPDHVIVLFGRKNTELDCDASKFFQAGSYGYHAQIGLLYDGQQMIRESSVV